MRFLPTHDIVTLELSEAVTVMIEGTARRTRLLAGGRGRLAVRVAGQSGAPIAMLHGLASSSLYWSPGVPRLSTDHQLLMPDLLGFGRSPKPFASDYSVEEHVAWLHRTLAPLVREPLTLVGQSMGSVLALHYALTFPNTVAGVVLISLPVIGCLPWGHRADGTSSNLHRLVAHTAFGARIAGVAIRLAGPIGFYFAPRIQRDVPVEAARDAMRVTAASYWRTLENVVYGTDVPAVVDRLQRPLVMIHGERDRTAPVEPVRELAASRPLVRLEVVEGAGHNPYFTHTEQVTRLIEEFSRQQRPLAASV